MNVSDFLIRLDERPAWQRHMVVGAGFVLFARGAWLGVPLIGLLLVITGGVAGLIMFGRMLLIVAALVAAGAMSGLAYTLMGSRVRRVPIVGPFLAGVVTGVPYLAAILAFVGYIEGDASSLTAPPPALAALCVLLAGLFGWVLFRD